MGPGATGARVPGERAHHQWAETPLGAFDPTGYFVVVWDSYLQDGSGFGVFAQAYDNAGSLVGSEFQVNQQTLGYQVATRSFRGATAGRARRIGSG